MIHLLSKEECIHLLKENNYGHLGCNDGFNTYIYPTGYVYEENSIVCQSLQGSKIEIMRKNNRVCFQVETFNEKKEKNTVTLLGNYIEVTDIAQRYQILSNFIKKMIEIKTSQDLSVLMKKSTAIRPIIYRILVDEIIGNTEK
ncbi:MAG: hypothetical protein FGM46_02115 [Ferruginibacter sp.]|nr:hypothetical protein [Ferruginibacter sp.]